MEVRTRTACNAESVRVACGDGAHGDFGARGGGQAVGFDVARECISHYVGVKQRIWCTIASNASQGVFNF